jgi:hypothetical protein
MGLQILTDGRMFSDEEKYQLFEMLKEQNIPMMTTETWRTSTGRSAEDLADFIKANCVIHDIRNFLSGCEQLGRSPKLLIMDCGPRAAFFLISLKMEYPTSVN